MAIPTSALFRLWARDHKAMARGVCAAMAFAQLERERVDAYVLPIFKTFRFLDENGATISSPQNVYLCNDEALRMAFYAQCDTAHRANGFRGPEGSSPALIAENLLLTAEEELINAGCAFFGSSPWSLVGEKRKKMLDLLLKAILNA